ncbi:hypothetical protein GW916_06045, partial [bacterium]|nr:hypothetical protein [bacterium]
MDTPHLILSYRARADFLPPEEKLSKDSEKDLFEILQKSLLPKILIFNPREIENCRGFLKKVREFSLDTLWIVENFESLPLSDQKYLFSFPQFFCGTKEEDPEGNRNLIELCSERISEINQELDLLRVLKSENLKLKAKLKSILSDSEKPATNTTSRGHLRMKALEEALIEILKAKTVKNLDAALLKSLSKWIPLEFARILFGQQSSVLEQQSNPLLIKVPLQVSPRPTKGWLILGLKSKKPLQEKDHELLEEIAEITSLSLNRILQLEASEGLKKQWDATFDAISDPLCLINEKMTILRTNTAFAKATERSFLNLIGENALKVFFKDNPEVWEKPPPLNLKMQ